MKYLINEAQVNREITYNPFDLFFHKKIVNGHFVTVGYLKDANEESPKITGQKNNISENDEQLHEYLDQYADTMWASDFAGITMEQSYQDALAGKRKTCKFEIEGNIVRIQRFTYQWRDPKNFGKAFDRQAEEEMQARAKYGFGEGFADDELGIENPDEWYEEDDWRRKPQYQGTGVRTRGLKKNASSGYRFATPAPGLYSYSGTDPEKMDRMAIRNMLDPRQNGTDPEAKKKSGYKSVYYYVSPDGVMEEIPTEVVNFLRYAYKGVRNVKAAETEQMAADEAEFNQLMAEIQAKYANKQQPTDLLFDHILYITASPIGWNDKARVNGKATKGTPMVFVNNRVIYQEFPYLKARYLNKVIGEFCSSIDVNKIEQVTEKLKNMQKYILNESSITKENLDEYAFQINAAFGDLMANDPELASTLEPIINAINNYTEAVNDQFDKLYDLNDLNESKKRKLYINMKRNINEGLFDKKSEGAKAVESNLKEFANGLKDRCKQLSNDEVDYLFDIFNAVINLIGNNTAKTPKDIAEYLYNYRFAEPKHVKILETIRKKFRGESTEEGSKEKNESYRLRRRNLRRLNEAVNLSLVRRAIEELKAMGYLEYEGDVIHTDDVANALDAAGVSPRDFDETFDELNRVLYDNYGARIYINEYDENGDLI